MHEMSVATSLIELAESEAAKAGCSRIISVQVKMGSFCGVELEPFSFALEISKKNTMLENARINFQIIPGTGNCRDCGNSFPVVSQNAKCPECGGNSVIINGGDELKVVSLEAE
jgi:hydrogenase nickel incorporation protein HypA/HybF